MTNSSAVIGGIAGAVAPGPPTGNQSLRARFPFVYYGLVAVVVIVVGCGLWLVHLAREAGGQLDKVRIDVTVLRASAESPSEVQVDALEADLRRRAETVRNETESPLWRLATHLPDFGSDFRVASGMAEITDSLAQNVLPPLVESSHGLSLTTLRRPDGSIDLDDLAKIRAATTAAMPALAQAQQRLARLDQRVHFNALGRARAQVGTQLQGIQTTLGTANQALELMPSMLGADGPRNYFLVFQNLAEARGTGGLMGTWGILHADHGALTLSRTGTDTELEKSTALKPATVEPGGGFGDTWDGFGPLADYAIANLSPSFGPAGQLFAEHAQQQLGMQIDGVIALDPRTLGTLLGKRTVTLSDGTVINGRNVLQVTESDLYKKYGENSAVRKQLLADLAKDAFENLKTASAQTLLKGLRGSISVGDLQLWSAHPAEEKVLADTDLGGIMPTKAGSFAHLVVNNTGPKTDLYLHRSVTYYAAAACPAKGDSDQTRPSEIDVTLTDEVPPGEAPIISQDEDDPTAPYGRGHDYVSVYGPVGAVYVGATLNGKSVDVETSTEQGHLVMSVDLLEPDGVPQVLAFQMVEPASHTLITWRPQPMGQPEKVITHYSPC